MLPHRLVTKGEPLDFSLVVGGPLYRLYLRAHLAEASMGLVHRRVLTLILITWVPLWVLNAFGAPDTGGASVSLLKDLDAHARLLLALPLLIVAEPIAHQRFTIVVRQFIQRTLIAPEDLRRFVAAVVSSRRLTNSAILEFAVLAVAFAGGHWLWINEMSLRAGTWYSEHTPDGTIHPTLAGSWYVFVSLPLFRFLLIRWYVRVLVVWYRFLWLMSRIPLRVNALHPDRAGGLGFLSTSVLAFVPFLVAQTTVLSALIAGRIWHEGATLPQFKGEILVALGFLTLLVVVPHCFFTLQLERARRTSAGEYGVLGSRYVEAFRRKWLGGHPRHIQPLVGSPDIQSLADLANAYEVVRDMSLVPISRKTIVRLAVVIAAPLIPLTLTMIPLEQLIRRGITLLM
jgi:hypothetical protein